MKRNLLSPLLIMLVAAGCTSLRPADNGQRESDIRELEERVLELQQMARMTDSELARLRRQIDELDDRLAAKQVGIGDPERAPNASPVESARVPSPSPSSGRLEQWQVESEELPSRSEAPSEGSGAIPVATEMSATAQELYDRGYTLYHQQRLIDAESAFQQFLQHYSSSDLADNAQFWIGEARFHRGDIEGALAAFRETVERFPSGNKVPDGLFKIGECLERLGDTEGARRTYQETIERFPTTAAAALAADRLDD